MAAPWAQRQAAEQQLAAAAAAGAAGAAGDGGSAAAAQAAWEEPRFSPEELRGKLRLCSADGSLCLMGHQLACRHRNYGPQQPFGPPSAHALALCFTTVAFHFCMQPGLPQPFDVPSAPCRGVSSHLHPLLSFIPCRRHPSRPQAAL